MSVSLRVYVENEHIIVSLFDKLVKPGGYTRSLFGIPGFTGGPGKVYTSVQFIRLTDEDYHSPT